MGPKALRTIPSFQAPPSLDLWRSELSATPPGRLATKVRTKLIRERSKNELPGHGLTNTALLSLPRGNSRRNKMPLRAAASDFQAPSSPQRAGGDGRLIRSQHEQRTLSTKNKPTDQHSPPLTARSNSPPEHPANTPKAAPGDEEPSPPTGTLRLVFVPITLRKKENLRFPSGLQRQRAPSNNQSQPVTQRGPGHPGYCVEPPEPPAGLTVLGDGDQVGCGIASVFPRDAFCGGGIASHADH